MKDKEYKYAEYLMYNYTRHFIVREMLIERYKILRAQGDIRVQDYEQRFDNGNRIRDPVSEHHERLCKLINRVKLLTQKIEPVKNLILELETPASNDSEYYKCLKNILKFIYIGRNDIFIVSELLRLSIRTIYRRKHELVSILRWYIK